MIDNLKLFAEDILEELNDSDSAWSRELDSQKALSHVEEGLVKITDYAMNYPSLRNMRLETIRRNFSKYCKHGIKSFPFHELEKDKQSALIILKKIAGHS